MAEAKPKQLPQIAVPEPMLIFCNFMAYELLTRETLSPEALKDVQHKRDEFLKSDAKLAGGAFMIKLRVGEKIEPVNIMVTILDAEESSAMGELDPKIARACAMEVGKMLWTTDKVIKKWHESFPGERVNSKVNKEKFMLQVNPDSESGMGFRGLKIQKDLEDSSESSEENSDEEL